MLSIHPKLIAKIFSGTPNADGYAQFPEGFHRLKQNLTDAV